MLGKPAAPVKVGHKDHPLKGYKFTDFAASLTDLAQADAKKSMPPKSYVWRGNLGTGAWHASYCHSLKTKHHSAQWASHSNDSFAAFKAVRRWAWNEYLSEHKLPLDHCPVKGIFG